MNETKIFLEQFCPNKKGVRFKQMNPENPDYRKINNCDFIVVDGSNLKPNTIRDVLKTTNSLISSECNILIINKPGRNALSHEEVGRILPRSKFVVE